MNLKIDVQLLGEVGQCDDCPLYRLHAKVETPEPSPTIENICFATADPEKLIAIAKCVEASFRPRADGITPVRLTQHNSYVALFYMFKNFGIVQPRTSVRAFVEQLGKIPFCATHVKNNFGLIVRSMQVEAINWKKGGFFVPYENLSRHFAADCAKFIDLKERIKALYDLMQEHHLIG